MASLESVPNMTVTYSKDSISDKLDSIPSNIAVKYSIEYGKLVYIEFDDTQLSPAQLTAIDNKLTNIGMVKQ